MSDRQDALIADLQAQIVALRLAVEGSWLSLLGQDPAPAGMAKRLGEQNVAAIGQMPADDEAAQAIKAAVVHHTQQLWGSIAWQLGEGKPA